MCRSVLQLQVSQSMQNEVYGYLAGCICIYMAGRGGGPKPCISGLKNSPSANYKVLIIILLGNVLSGCNLLVKNICINRKTT
jgi:hypothetical protein